MTTNRIKRAAKRILPGRIVELVQRVRRIRYRPPPEIEEMRAEYIRYQNGGADTITLRPGITVRIDPQSREPFEWFCFRSPEMVRELDYFLAHCTEYSSFVDVGANHGIFSLTFSTARPGAKVLAIDPSPVAFKILNRNKDLNGRTSIQTRNVACGNQRGEIRMVWNWHHLEAVRDGHSASENAISMPMVPLDDICLEHDLLPELLKIDVEGFELPVLEGATRALAAAKLLFLEIHPERIDALGLSQGAIFDLLVKREWHITSLRERPISRAEFVDQIHTFWTVCRKVKISRA
jgi:FkbM family methyltransferase